MILEIKHNSFEAEIAELKIQLREKDAIIEQQEKDITRLSSIVSSLQEIEKLLSISKAELGNAVGKIELSTNNAISDFSNISGLFSDTINSTRDLVFGIKKKLNIATVKENGGNAKTSDNVQLVATSDIRGKYEAIVNHILEEMTSIVKRKTEDLTLLDDVNLKVVGISNFANQIGKIASYSHILSINARCEAAHAGEWGKSFTVVATEIGRLSKETREFADKIDEDLNTAKVFIENSTLVLKNAIDIESSFINSTIFLMKDVFMSIIDGLISLITLVEKNIGESSEINSNIQNVVVNLQFEDVTKQISTHVMELVSRVIEGIQSINDSNHNSDEEISLAVESLTTGIHELFTMESERIVAAKVLGNHNGKNVKKTLTKNLVKKSSDTDDVTFF